MSRARLTRAATAVVLVVLSACSSSTKHSSPAPTTRAPVATPAGATTSTTSTPATVQIVSFTGPPSPVTCNAPTQVQLHWNTRGASKVELRIDGGAVFATYPGGAREPLVPLACDAGTHSYELTARATNGDTVTKTLELAERSLVS